MASAGRPRTFDRDEALRKAMLVFWKKGYEGTTMADLVHTIGMKAPSVYAAFGNKDALFNEVVELYCDIVQSGPLKALNEHESVYKAVESSLKRSVEMFSTSSCLVMTAAINCAPENSSHVENLKKLRTAYREAFAARFRRAVADNQLVEGASPEALAEFYTTFVQGMALRARDGSSKAELQTSSAYALNTIKSVLKQDTQ